MNDKEWIDLIMSNVREVQCRYRSPCWIWQGSSLGRKGYAARWGVFRGSKRSHYLHRLVYLLKVGAIPKGYEVDHLCMEPMCVRPDHLEAVTQAENMRRANMWRWHGVDKHNRPMEARPQRRYRRQVAAPPQQQPHLDDKKES